MKVLDQGRIIGINEIHTPYLYLWQLKRIRFIRKGIYIGNMIRDQLIPEHDLAMWGRFQYHNQVELTYEQALQYLRKDALSIEADKGWAIARYGGINLGWLKNLGNRINNYYPTHLRLRLK
jgi:NOL1/NOP2/fmu family ribosome biogenesis protein